MQGTWQIFPTHANLKVSLAVCICRESRRLSDFKTRAVRRYFHLVAS